jgi:uncharacterized membrane protein YkvA (DUF1232 family)
MDLRPWLGLVTGVVALWVALIVLLWILRPRDAPLREALGTVPDVVRLVRGLIADGGQPLGVRLALVGLIAYVVNPIDLIPEFLPVVGPLDDIVVVVVVLRYVQRRVGVDELRQRWAGTQDSWRLLQRVLG